MKFIKFCIGAILFILLLWLIFLTICFMSYMEFI